MHKTEYELRRRLPRIAAGALATAATALLFAGCNSIATQNVNPIGYDYHARHPILVSEEPEALDMPVGMRGPALTPEIETAIRDYVNEYRADGTGSITIQVPSGSANEVAAASTGRAVHYALVRAGVPRGRIQVAPYDVGDHSRVAALRLSYLRVKAVVPRCGIWPDGSAANFDNTRVRKFRMRTAAESRRDGRRSGRLHPAAGNDSGRRCSPCRRHQQVPQRRRYQIQRHTDR